MTREEYLNELKSCILALPVEEQNEALDYYYNYFEDANDDEKVIAELGSPAKLAEEIEEKFTCVPATKETKTQSENDDKYKELKVNVKAELLKAANEFDNKVAEIMNKYGFVKEV